LLVAKRFGSGLQSRLQFFINVTENHFVEFAMKQGVSGFIASRSHGEAIPMLQSAIPIIECNPRRHETVQRFSDPPRRDPRDRGTVSRVRSSGIRFSSQGCDTEHSDLDILVDPTPETTLLDIGAIRHELLQLLGVPVDVLTPKALPDKYRAAVLAEAVAV
jgi:predicted nucleotidyltransferase